MQLAATSKIKEASFGMKIIRANGDIEDLGIVSYYSSNPFKNLAFKIKNLFKK